MLTTLSAFESHFACNSANPEVLTFANLLNRTWWKHQQPAEQLHEQIVIFHCDVQWLDVIGALHVFQTQQSFPQSRLASGISVGVGWEHRGILVLQLVPTQPDSPTGGCAWSHMHSSPPIRLCPWSLHSACSTLVSAVDVLKLPLELVQGRAWLCSTQACKACYESGQTLPVSKHAPGLFRTN